MQTRLTLLILTVFLIGCTATTIDSSSDSHSLNNENLIENKLESGTKSNIEANQNTPTSEPSNTGAVFINNQQLTASQITELEEFYGVAPLPGEYWYDSLSGSYGVAAGPSLGVIFPGHKFGELAADASNGDTGVFINGRELPEPDIQFLEWIFGVQRQAGRYWQDAQGNIGLEGEVYPLVNLYVAYSQRNRGLYNSKDNYWAANFGAYGNEQNGFGYVMVDGVSVTYGG
jgi:hypothetical protein